MRNLSKRLWQDEQGRDLVEVALIAALITLTVIVAIQMFGTAIQRVFISASASPSGHTT